MPSITLNSVQYFFESQGPHAETKPTLVLLHGSGGDSSVWSGQIKALADNHHVIAPDLPGHGQSPGGTMRNPEEYADWLKHLVESLQLHPFVLAGHSLGGIIAQQFAHMFPDTLKGLILIGTGMQFDIPAEYLTTLSQDFDSACEISGRQAYAAKMPPEVLEKGITMLRRNGPETLMQDLMLCADFDSTQWAHTLTMPCLIVCGAQDSITPCELSAQLARTISGSTLKYCDTAGHMVMQEQAELFNRHVSLFIKNKC